MISRLHFENFKSLFDVDLEPDRFTVLVGPNAAGKSSLLEAAHLLAQAGVPLPNERSHLWRRFATIFGAGRSPVRFASAPGAGPILLRMEEKDGNTLSVAVEIPPPHERPTADHLQWPFKFTITLDDRAQGGTVTQELDPHGRPTNINLLDDDRVRAFGSAVLLRLDSAVMANTSYVEAEVPHMEANGYGLASTLAYLKGARSEVVREIEADLRKVIPGVRELRIARTLVSRPVVEELNIEGQLLPRMVEQKRLEDRFEVEFEGVGSIPSDLLSEGTVLALGLITRLHDPDAPRLVLLDDIDRGLHIGAQARLVDVLRGVLAARPELQILCTTHSPDFVSRCEFDEVRVVALDARRHTRVRRLTEHPEFEKLRYGFQTGEIWAALGEDWAAAEGSHG